MSTIAIIGAGAVGLSSAALLRERGHDVRIWSSIPAESDALRRSRGVASEGALCGFFEIPAASDAASCIEGAEAVMIAAPAFAHASLIDAIAPHVVDGQFVIMHSATAMTSLMLARALARRRVDATLVDLGTSVCTSRRAGPTTVRVTPLKAGIDLATLPADRCDAGIAMMERLFGPLFTARENILTVSLNNHNGIYHVPALVFNLATVERAQEWNIWGSTTPLVARYVQRLDDERLAVARAYGVVGIPVADYIRRSIGVEGEDLATVFAEAARKRPNPTGPKSLDDRYVTEDVPYGLVFFSALGRAAGVGMPLTEQLTSFVSAVFAADFAAEGISLEALGVSGLSPPSILQVVSNGF
jgi:opine dehydrogenase